MHELCVALHIQYLAASQPIRFKKSRNLFFCCLSLLGSVSTRNASQRRRKLRPLATRDSNSIPLLRSHPARCGINPYRWERTYKCKHHLAVAFLFARTSICVCACTSTPVRQSTDRGAKKTGTHERLDDRIAASSTPSTAKSHPEYRSTYCNVIALGMNAVIHTLRVLYINPSHHPPSIHSSIIIHQSFIVTPPSAVDPAAIPSSPNHTRRDARTAWHFDIRHADTRHHTPDRQMPSRHSSTTCELHVTSLCLYLFPAPSYSPILSCVVFHFEHVKLQSCIRSFVRSFLPSFKCMHSSRLPSFCLQLPISRFPLSAFFLPLLHFLLARTPAIAKSEEEEDEDEKEVKVWKERRKFQLQPSSPSAHAATEGLRMRYALCIMHYALPVCAYALMRLCTRRLSASISGILTLDRLIQYFSVQPSAFSIFFGNHDHDQ